MPTEELRPSTPSVPFQPLLNSTPIAQKQKDYASEKDFAKVFKPSVSVCVDWPSGPKKRSLRDDLVPLGKSLIKGTYNQIAFAAWKSPGLRDGIISVMKREINKECCSLCSVKNASIFRKTSKEDMLNFSWQNVANELEEKAPILHTFLKAASTPAKRSDHQHAKSKWLSGTCMAAAVLLKNRSRYMTAVQLLITVIIQHSGLMVISNLIFY